LFSLGVTDEVLPANMVSKSAISLQRGPVDLKFRVEEVAPYQPFFFWENWAKWYFVWYKNLDRSFFRFAQSTRLTDGRTIRRIDVRTDSFLIARQRLHCMQRGKNRSRNATVRVLADGQIHWLWQTQTDQTVGRLVCQTRGFWQNGRKICPDFYTIYEGAFIQFPKKNNGWWGATPYTLNFGLTGPHWSEIN